MKQKKQIFNPLTSPLSGWNLVEASAGTGKTYSIALLVLRLMLEQKLRLKEILLVTFTNAATAELEERIRLFIRTAKQIALGKQHGGDIAQIVQNAISLHGEEEVKQLLKDAVYLLDERSIYTIHSFCQHILSEFAVETKQFFTTELIEDISLIYEASLHQFCRKKIATLPAPLLQYLYEAEEMPSMSTLNYIIKEVMAGRKWMGIQNANFSTPLQARVENQIQQRELIRQSFDDTLQKLNAELNSDPITYKKLLGFKNDNTFQNFIEDPFNKDLNKAAEKNRALLSRFFAIYERAKLQKRQLDEAAKNIQNEIIFEAIESITKEIAEHKEKLQIHSFDDFINNLYNILASNDSESLKQILQQRYKAAFIDEFQDTDTRQFRIFELIFAHSKTVMYFIGDPKQSIYEFRGADVDNYLLAKQKMGNLFSMNTNYRSSAEMISALNKFLLPQEGFDTFFYQQEQNRIDYEPVTGPPKNEKQKLLLDGKPLTGISQYAYPNNTELNDGVAALIQNLLFSDRYALSNSEQLKPVLPSDIAVLCRSKTHAENIQKALQDVNISSIIGKESRILDSTEAKNMVYLLEAIESPSKATIARALLSNFFKHTIDELSLLNESTLLNLFTGYKHLWIENGPYPALVKLSDDLGIKQNLLATGLSGDEKILSNYNQLIEILNRLYNKNRSGPYETNLWLAKAITDKNSQENDYLQRLETDEQAIRIDTIHKSKGLEYKIVICPDLDLTDDSKATEGLKTIKDPATLQKILGWENSFTDAQKDHLKINNERENRRLLYVATTRAVSHLFIFKNTYHGFKNSTLSNFIPDYDRLPQVEPFALKRKSFSQNNQQILVSNFPLKQQHWAKLSYSYLSGQHNTTVKERTYELDDEYENFINNQLGRGAQIGTMLHEIFETLQFDKQSYYLQSITPITEKYAYLLNNDNAPKLLLQLVENVLKTNIVIDNESFCLADIDDGKQIPELEFDIPLRETTISILQSLSTEAYPILLKNSPEIHEKLEGILNGKIDLFFEHGGKYYILDWKSNYLGPHLSYYSPQNIKAAMDENNYHLQYFIYTLAAKKFLESRIDGEFSKLFGGVIYIFLRGARAGKTTGTFIANPSKDIITQLNQIFQ